MAAQKATVVIQTTSESLRNELAAAIGSNSNIEVLQPAAAPRADAVLLPIGPDALADIALAGRMLQEGRARQIILVGPAPSPEMLLAAMHAGIGEYLPEPLQPAGLTTALERLRSRSGKPLAAAEAQSGRTILVLGSKGGVGTTTIAVNLADGMHRLCAAPTALIDLAQPQGDAPIFLDLDHAYTWADVAANMSRLDATYLESVMARHHSGLAVLAAPGYSAEPTMNPAVLRQILALMRGMYAFVVIDAGTGQDDAALEALELADEVLLVLDLSLPCLARAKRFLEAVRSSQPELAAKIRLVANRKASDSDIGIGEAEGILRTSVSWSVLNDYKTALTAINQGKTLAETDPRSDIARGVAAIARDLAKSTPAEPDSFGSLWSRLRNMPLGFNLARRNG